MAEVMPDPQRNAGFACSALPKAGSSYVLVAG
jgi:hypothetical protein